MRGEYRTGDDVLIDVEAGDEESEGKLVFTRKEPEPIAVEWSTGKPAQAGSEQEPDELP